MPIEATDDYYAILGVAPNADAAQLRRAWRQRAVRWHPDRAGPSATFIFQKILSAYAVLANPTSRADYDRRRGLGARTALAHPSENRPVGRRAPGVLLQRLSGPLSGLLACGTARRAEPDLIELQLSREEASRGGMVSISMKVAVQCPGCVGDRTASCARCGMKRTVKELYTAWLAIPPEVRHGALLIPSAALPGMLRPVSFRVRLGEPA